jgi:hypothetical protein
MFGEAGFHKAAIARAGLLFPPQVVIDTVC